MFIFFLYIYWVYFLEIKNRKNVYSADFYIPYEKNSNFLFASKIFFTILLIYNILTL